jgi:KTSC domain
MAKRKTYRRTAPLGSETVYADPREAERQVRALLDKGAVVHGTRAAMSSVGIQPHHYGASSRRFETREKPAKRGLPDAEALLLAQQTDMVSGPVRVTYAPTPSINPADPRTAAAGYDPILQRLRIEFADNGVPYNYYDVPPQIWDAFQQAPSPGRFINAVLNYFSYGIAED